MLVWDKAAVLAALYNASKPQGMGFMHYDPAPMTVVEAGALLRETTQFDYLKGRVMKINLAKDEVETRSYDRDNGPEAFKCVVDILRQSGDTNDKSFQDTHSKNTAAAALDVESQLDRPSTMQGGVLSLGLSDVKGHLAPRVAAVTKKRD